MSDEMPFVIPVSPDRVVVVEGFPVTEPEWDQLMAVLQAMKPGLVKP